MAKVKENVETWKDYLDAKLKEDNAVAHVFAKLEEKTRINRLYLAIGLIVFVAVYLMIGYGSQLLCNFIGFIYPAYASIKAIESPAKEDDTQWLIYWVVYSVFALAELFTDVFFFWIPFYWFFKCLFLVWCMVPAAWNGADFIYQRVVRPAAHKYAGTIDQALKETAGAAEKFLDEGKKIGQQLAKEGVKAALSKGD